MKRTSICFLMAEWVSRQILRNVPGPQLDRTEIQKLVETAGYQIGVTSRYLLGDVEERVRGMFGIP